MFAIASVWKPSRKILTLLIAGFFSLAQGAEKGYWDERFSTPPTANWWDTVMQLLTDKEGRLIVAGAKHYFSPTAPASISRWDGIRWSTIAANAGTELTATWHTGDLIAAGRFSDIDLVPAANIARWDGANWSALGNGLGGRVNALASDGTYLWAAGEFTNSGPDSIANVGRWNGVQWESPGPSLPGAATALLVTNGAAYTAWRGAASQQFISVLKDGEWVVLGEFAGSLVRSLAWFRNSLYVSGQFTKVNDVVIAADVAEWRDGQWRDASTKRRAQRGVTPALSVLDDQLYLFGSLMIYDESSKLTDFATLLRRAADSWENISHPFSRDAFSVAVHGKHIFAAFGTSQRISPFFPGLNLFHFDGAQWQGLNNGVEQWRSFGQLASREDGVLASFIAKYIASPLGIVAPPLWDGANFIGTTNGSLAIRSAIANVNGKLYAHAWDEQRANVLARLDGQAWTAATKPLSFASVACLAGNAEKIYAAGRNGLTGNSEVHEWNGTNWTRLDGEFLGQPDSIKCMALAGNQLIAGGNFTSLSGTNLSYLARWDGESWKPVGKLDGAVTDIAVHGDRLYAIGSFSQIDGIEVNHVAAWDGHRWSALGRGFANAAPVSISVSQEGKIAVLARSSLPSQTPNAILIWRGNEWENTGQLDGLAPQDSVWAGNDLYISGDFRYVNFRNTKDIASFGFAIWHEPGVVLHPAKDSSIERSVRVSGAVPFKSAVEVSLDLRSWAGIQTNILGAPGQKFRVSSNRANEFFRLREVTP